MLNNVVLVGRVGKDPEIKFTDAGKAKTTFSLAVDKPFKKQDGQDNTNWFRVECWDKTAQSVADHVRKGSVVGVQGRIDIQKWKDRESGQDKEMTVIVADQVRFVGPKPATNDEP